MPVLLQLYALHVLNAGKADLVFFHCYHCGLTELRMNVDFAIPNEIAVLMSASLIPDAPAKPAEQKQHRVRV